MLNVYCFLILIGLSQFVQNVQLLRLMLPIIFYLNVLFLQKVKSFKIHNILICPSIAVLSKNVSYIYVFSVKVFKGESMGAAVL